MLILRTILMMIKNIHPVLRKQELLIEKNIPKKRKIVNVVTPPAKKQRTKGPQEFKCETCDKNFSRKFTLQRHMNNKH